MDTREKKLKSDEVRMGDNGEDLLEKQPNTQGEIFNCLETQRHPLYIDTILRCIFGFCDYETLKDCRYISRRWKKLCDPFFVKSSAFAYTNTDTRSISVLTMGDLEPISKIFDSFEDEVRLTAFKFDRNCMTAAVKEMYLDPFKLLMTQLEISKSNEDAPAPDVLAGTDDIIDAFIGPNIRKLTLICDTDNDEAMSISLEKIAKISKVSIQQCTLLKSSNDIKIEPTELALVDWNQKRHANACAGTVFPTGQLNSFIEFKKIQKLHLDARMASPRLPVVNFRDLVNIKRLTLFGMQVNLDGKLDSQYLDLYKNKYILKGEEVKYFVINDYLKSSEFQNMELLDEEITIVCEDILKIKSLMLGSSDQIKKPENIDYYDEFDAIDDPNELQNAKESGNTAVEKSGIKKLSMDTFNLYHDTPIYIPEAITVLRVLDVEYPIPLLDGRTPVGISLLQPGCRIGIKQLKLQGDCSTFLKSFRDCKSIVDLSLKGFQGFLFEDNGETVLPPNIKRLALWNVQDIEIEKNMGLIPKPYNLSVLVLPSEISEDVSCSFVFEAFAKFTADLVVFYSYEYDYEDDDRSPEHISRRDVDAIIRMKQKFQLEKVAFGPVESQTEENFKNSILYSIVDKKADYYILEGDGGRVISDTEFLSFFNDMMV